ncbi:MAG: hypothetical protein AAFY72_11195 [Cyanobacteria bacterium J06649_4]
MNSNQPTALPTEENHFKARYAPWIGSVLLILGLVNVLLALWLMLLSGQFSSTIITGVILTAVGYLYLTRPYFAIAPNRLTIYNLLGSSIKRYPFASFSDFSLKENKLFIADNTSVQSSSTTGQGEKINVKKWMVKPADWKTLSQFIGSK